jgi:hypothetical protein
MLNHLEYFSINVLLFSTSLIAGHELFEDRNRGNDETDESSCKARVHNKIYSEGVSYLCNKCKYFRGCDDPY